MVQSTYLQIEGVLSGYGSGYSGDFPGSEFGEFIESGFGPRICEHGSKYLFTN